MPISCVKSVKIYTGQIFFTQIYSWRSWQISGMQQGDQKFHGQRSNFGLLVFSKRDKGFSRKNDWEYLHKKMMSRNRWTKRKASVLSYEVILLIGFQPSNGGCSWFPKIFGISLISEESMPKKRLQREVCWGRSKKEIPAQVSPRGLSMPKPLEYIPWSPRNIFALNLIFYKYILFCLKECLMRVVSLRNKLTAVEFCFFFDLLIKWTSASPRCPTGSLPVG